VLHFACQTLGMADAEKIAASLCIYEHRWRLILANIPVA
jgi:hypothetical protein